MGIDRARARRPCPQRAHAASARTPLSLTDRDDDGLLDLERDDGSWVGWDATMATFVVKP